MIMDKKLMQEKMDKALSVLKQNFGSVRTGRANPSLIENILVDAYGTKMPMQQLASITAPEPRMLLVNPFDRSNTQAIEKAIQTADLGLNPQDDGHVIRIVLPDLNEERRNEMVKVIKQYAEDARVAIRNVRREFMDEIKNDSELSEDQMHDEQDNVQRVTDNHIKQVDDLFQAKEKEVLTV
jgi:ribosome recycling factor